MPEDNPGGKCVHVLYVHVATPEIAMAIVTWPISTLLEMLYLKEHA